MIQLRHRQPSLWHSGLAKDIEDLWEPWLLICESQHLPSCCQSGDAHWSNSLAAHRRELFQPLATADLSLR